VLAVCLSMGFGAVLAGDLPAVASTTPSDTPDPCVPITAMAPLRDGQVLLTGMLAGAVPESRISAERFDPVSGSVSPTGEMVTPRFDHTATSLADGRILIVGGTAWADTDNAQRAEVYDPITGTFTETGSTLLPRTGQTATLLADGRVLIVGGAPGGTAAELYDPQTGVFSAAGAMDQDRVEHTATLLADGRVLITGGRQWARRLPRAEAELFDPASGTFTTTGPMTTPRAGHTATLLPDGRVLIAGGIGRGALASAEIYDPASGTFSPAASMTKARADHAAIRLADGRVLLVGGDRAGESCAGGVRSAEVYDPGTDSFVRTGLMALGDGIPVVTGLPDGRVLVVHDTALLPALPTETAEMYEPATGSFATADGSVTTRAPLVSSPSPEPGSIADATEHVPFGPSPSPTPETRATAMDWTRVPLAGKGTFADVTGWAGGFVIVGSRGPDAASWVSRDGVSWTRARAQPTLRHAAMEAVVAHGKTLIALGRTETGSHGCIDCGHSGPGETILAWHSKDGLHWQRAPVARPRRAGGLGTILSLADGPAGLLAIGVFYGPTAAEYAAWRSTAGRSWRPAEVPRASILKADKTRYVVNFLQRFQVSNHLHRWRPLDAPRRPNLNEFLLDGHRIMALGFRGIWLGEGGGRWQEVLSLAEVGISANDFNWLRLDRSSEGYIATASLWNGLGADPEYSGVVFTSTDGIDWVRSDDPDLVSGLPLAAARKGDITILVGSAPVTTQRNRPVVWRSGP
jgi:hypothetical protein